MTFTLGRCGTAIFAAACLASATAQTSRPAGPPAPVLPGALAPAPGSTAPSAPVGGPTSRPAFATAVFLSDWDRWSADAVRKLKTARILDSSAAVAAEDEARAVGREIRRLSEVSALETAVDSRPAERSKRAIGEYEELLGTFVEKGGRKKQNRRIEALSELKDLREIIAARVDATAERKKRIAAVADRMKILRARLVPAVRDSEIRAPQITPFLDLTEDLGLCGEALRRAVEDDAALHQRLTRLLAAYDEAVAVYRG